MNTFTRAELEAIYVLFDTTNVRGIANKMIQLAVLERAHAMIQEISKPIPVAPPK